MHPSRYASRVAGDASEVHARSSEDTVAIFATSSTHSANRRRARRSDGGGIAPNHASGERGGSARRSFASATPKLDALTQALSFVARASASCGVADAVVSLRRRPPPSPETASSLRSAAEVPARGETPDVATANRRWSAFDANAASAALSERTGLASPRGMPPTGAFSGTTVTTRVVARVVMSYCVRETGREYRAAARSKHPCFMRAPSSSFSATSSSVSSSTRTNARSRAARGSSASRLISRASKDVAGLEPARAALVTRGVERQPSAFQAGTSRNWRRFRNLARNAARWRKGRSDLRVTQSLRRLVGLRRTPRWSGCVRACVPG